jgi:hypothetical protein
MRLPRPFSQLLASALAVAADCRTYGVTGRLTSLLAAQLAQHLPPDAAGRCTGRAHIGITRLWPKPRSKVTSILLLLRASCCLFLISCCYCRVP